MASISRKLVTIIAPDYAEESLVPRLAELGWGLSVVPIHGRGAHGSRPDIWHGANIEIQIVTEEERVGPLLELLERESRRPTAIVAWVSDVQAWPAERFGGGSGEK